MRKLLPIILTLLLLFSFLSCDTESSIFGTYKKNPFIDKVELNKDNTDDNVIQFSMITDVHIGKDKTSTSVWPLIPLLEKYKEYLDNNTDNNVEFILNLGDLLDNGYEDAKYMDESMPYFNDVPFIYTMGNHDRSNTLFENVDFSKYPNIYPQTMQCYTYTASNGKSLSIYKLENSRRTYTKQQLKWLEEALILDDSDYKVFIGHIPLVAYIDNTNSTSFAISDIAERNEITRLMKEYGVNVTFAGHHHKGKFHTIFTETTSEVVLSSFHKSDRKAVPTIGHFYDCIFDFESGELEVQAYLTENGEMDDINYKLYL